MLLLAPPARPLKFRSREELKRYLQLVCLRLFLVCNAIRIYQLKVHQYYAVIGRPRFGRSLQKLHKRPNDISLFDFVDKSDDGSVPYEEFHNQIGT